MLSNKIAFVHIMKTGGSSISTVFRESLPQGLFFNSWDRGLDRDWTASEMEEIAELPQGVIHNHVTNWSEPMVDFYLKNGWCFMANFRHVGDQLCSLHHWLYSTKPHLPYVEMDEYIAKQVLKQRTPHCYGYQDWQIPKWWRKIHSFEEISDAFVQKLATQLKSDKPPVRKNVGGNFGFDHYIQSGRISQTTHDLIMKSEFWDRYLAAKEAFSKSIHTS